MKRKRPPAVSRGSPPPAAAFAWRPWLLVGMTALFVARPLFPSESAASYGDGLTVVILWIALGVFWLLGAIGRPQFLLRFGWTDAAVLLLVLWHTAAALWAAAYGTPRPAVNMLWEWVGLGLCFFLARQLIVTPREARAVAAVMVALAVAISGYGLYQRAYELPHTRAKYKANPDRALSDAGLSFPPDSPGRKLFEDRLANTEPMATFALTNSLAGFLAPWLVVLAGMICGAGRNGKRLLGMAVPLIPIAVCLLLTKSRSGYAGVCAGLLLVWLLCRGRRVRIGWKLPAVVLGVVVLLISAAMVVEGPEVLQRASKSFGYRLQYWQSSLRMIADHPWLGCGPGNFQEVYTQYKLPKASEEIADPHNFLLEIWATAGTPAALAFLGVLGCFAWSTLRGEGRGAGDEGRGNEGEAKIANLPSPNGRGAGGEGGQHRSQPTLTLTLSQRERGPSPDAWLYVLLGGLIGFLLSLPLGMLSAAPPGVAPVLLGLPLAAATVAALLGWIREGQLPRWLPAVGVAVLLINLSAAGGIGLPGVAGTFWLLLAMGLQHESRRPHGPLAAWAMLAVAVALAAACYTTAYRPVVECQAQLHLAEQASVRAVEHLREATLAADSLSAEKWQRLAKQESDRATEHLEAAAAADPLWAEPWQRLAAARFEAWQHLPSRAAFERFEQADAEALRLAPNSAPTWAASGEWYLQAISVAKRRGERPVDDAIGKAVAACGRAVELYPTSARARAKLAEAYAAAGDQPAFRREAEEALRLDKETPHPDKKLPADLREKLVRELDGPP